MRIDKLVIAGIVSMSMLASCAGSDNGQSPTEPASPVNFTLTLAGSPVSKTAITGDPASTDENTINRVAVGLFDASGNLVSLTELNSGTSNFNGSNALVTGNTLVTKVAVAANMKPGLFAAVKQLSDFEKLQADLDYTASIDASTAGTAGQYATALPMVGESLSSDVSIPSGGTGTAAVTGTAKVYLTRLVSKITLSNITTTFASGGGYPHASFTPTEVFMYNVPSLANCNLTSVFATAPTWLHGEQVATVLSTLTPKNYLGTGNLGITLPLTSTNPWVGKYNFYVFPDQDNANHPMELIIKGNFVDDTTVPTTPTVVYYPIIINHAMAGTTGTGAVAFVPDGTDGVVQNNRAFDLTANITSKGVSNPSILINTANVTVTVSVNPWPTTITQNNTF